MWHVSTSLTAVDASEPHAACFYCQVFMRINDKLNNEANRPTMRPPWAAVMPAAAVVAAVALVALAVVVASLRLILCLRIYGDFLVY